MIYTVTQRDIEWVNAVKFEAEEDWASSKDSYKKGAGSNGQLLYKMGVLGEHACRELLRKRPTASDSTFSEIDTRPLKPWERVPYDLLVETPSDKGTISTLIDVKTGRTKDLRVKQSVVRKFLNYSYPAKNVQKLFVTCFYDRKGRKDNHSYMAGDEISISGFEHACVLADKKNEKKARGGRNFLNYEINSLHLKQF